MRLPTPVEPPYDAGWLDQLADVCRSLTASTPRLQDLYLERRLELTISSVAGSRQLEEIRSEGAAVRWRYPSRATLHARTGTSSAALEDLLSRHGRRVAVPRSQPVRAAEAAAPGHWMEWADALLGRVRGDHCTARYLARQAVVIRPDGWVAVWTPELVRIELDGSSPAALLAVWPHPNLTAWTAEMLAPAAGRAWRPPAGLRVPVLLSEGTAGVLLHELIGHLVESDLVLGGDSPLADMAGATVTSERIRISDDPGRADLPGAFNCDDEGAAASAIDLVRDGRLVGFLCDREGARKLAAAAGRGRRGSWDRAPVPRLSNLIVAAGDEDPEAIERSLAEGLVVSRLGGATVEPVTGRVLLRVERGWEVRGGRRRRPTEPFELAGGAIDVLTHVEPRVGSDATADWRLGWCLKDGLPLPTGSEAPSLLVHRLEVL